MELTKKDIEDFAESATLTDHKKFALIVAQILNKTQLKALQPYFTRSISFNAAAQKAAVPLDAEDEDGEPDVPEAPQQPIAPKPAQDFGFGDMPRRGRPPMMAPREVAEREFDEVIKRKPIF